jgi:hypothetical protein
MSRPEPLGRRLHSWPVSACKIWRWADAFAIRNSDVPPPRFRAPGSAETRANRRKLPTREIH